MNDLERSWVRNVLVHTITELCANQVGLSVETAGAKAVEILAEAERRAQDVERIVEQEAQDG